MTTSLQTFAAYVRDRATVSGYRIHRRRGKRALARAAGMSYGEITATLAGTYCPWPLEMERLADALGVSLITLLVDSGYVRPRTTP